MTSTTTTTPPSRPHPRVRERRRDVVRDAGKRRLTILAVVLVLVALLVTSDVLAHSSLFSASHLTVDGATHTSASTILAASGLEEHPPLLDVGAANLAGIERLPWVQSARLSRHFPDSVTITVTERHAVVAASEPDGAVALLDPSGRVLSQLGRHATAPAGLVPIVTPGGLGAPGVTVSGETAALVRAASAVPVGLLAEIDNLGVTRSLGVVVHLRNGAVAQLGTASDLVPKYVALSSLLANHTLAAGVVADLRIPSSPVLNG